MAEPSDATEQRSSTKGLSVGEVVSDRYRIDAVLGEGGMGIVYRAEHLYLHKPHALKVLLPEWSSTAEVVARFEREAIAAGNIQSPHVAAATDFGRLPSGAFFLVMEYVNGRTLADALEAGALEPARALHVLLGIASALHAAHAMGVVHRDLKPENVMLIERDGDRDFVKVLDFGIARVDGLGSGSQASAGKALTKVGAVIGTPKYMSPEQALGQPVDGRSDLYSVGIILYEMLAGRCPFEGDAVSMLRQRVMDDVPELPSAVVGSIDPRIGVIVRRLLAKTPENRLANAAELMAAIDECVNEVGQGQAPMVRPSLESVQGMTTPVAQRVRRSLLSGIKAIDGAARRALADPRAVARNATRGRVMVTIIIIVAAVTTIVALAAGGKPHTPSSTAAPPSIDSTADVLPTSAPLLPSTEPTGSADVVPVSNLPPPPAPSPSTAVAGAQSSHAPQGRPLSSHGQSRRTGPGGIYIPPPSQWFK